LTDRLQAKIGKFPFQSFWGPLAGLPSTTWIAESAAELLRSERPDLTLVYLPHLDYDPQRYGPDGCNMPRLVQELDQAAEPLLDAAQKLGCRVWVVSEYGHVQVRRSIELNRVLRRAGFLVVRPGPFGESLDTFGSRAFAVCDHQLAHVYVREPDDLLPVKEYLAALAGVARVLAGEERAEVNLLHPRSGELVVLAEPDAWFAYPYWLDDRQAPDFARTVDIHRKPGFDPCELFFDPDLSWPRGRAMLRFLQKSMGFRTLFDVIPLKPELVRGSHGVAPKNPDNRPLLIGDGPAPDQGELPMTAVHGLILGALGLA
jgi:predicted AlkP superfamily pyrophosphatase or phosphodiesterase